MLLEPLLRDARLKPAETILQVRQHDYAARLLKVSKEHPTQSILPVSFREKNQHVQSEKQSLEDQE